MQPTAYSHASKHRSPLSPSACGTMTARHGMRTVSCPTQTMRPIVSRTAAYALASDLQSTICMLPEPAQPRVEPGWSGLYRIGGVCALLAGLFFAVGAALSVIIGPAPAESEAYVHSLAARPFVSRLDFAVFAASDVLLVPVSLALCLAIGPARRGAAVVGAALLALYAVVDLSVTEMSSLALVNLTQSYASANPALRGMYLAAADYARAAVPVGTFLSYLLSSVGLLIVSLAMRNGVFSRFTAWVGIVAAIEGIVAGFYVVVPTLALLLVPSLVAFAIWCVLVGGRLYKSARSIGAPLRA